MTPDHIYSEPDVTRLTVVADAVGVMFEDYSLYANGVDILVQDDGRTLKIIPRPVDKD